MSKLLAIEWNRSKVRYVLANKLRRTAKVIAAELIPLEHPPVEEETPEAQIGKTIQEALTELKSGRMTTLIAVGRSHVELWDLSLPAAQDSELPELVANVVLNETGASAPDDTLDFATTDASSDSRHVVASTLPAPELERVRATCEVAGLTPDRIVLRPYPAASLFLQATDQPDRPTLLINVTEDEADLTVTANGRVRLSRTVRLPTVRTETSAAKRLIAEIRRTLIAIPPASSDTETPGTIEAVYVFGGQDEYQQLIDLVRSELELPAELFDPFGAIDCSKGVVPEEDSGSFAPLLGMVADEARGARHAIDFLNPKKPPKPPNRKRTVLMAAAGVLCAVLGGAYYVWSTLAEADVRNAELAATLRELDELKKHAQKKKTAYSVVRIWQADSVNWLDELRDTALRMPSQRDVVLRSLVASPARGGGGRLTVNGVARSQSVVIKMEQGLRDKFHQIQTPRLEERLQDKAYTWHFESSVHVVPRTKSEYVSHLPEPATPYDGAAEKQVAEKQAAAETQKNVVSRSKPVRTKKR